MGPVFFGPALEHLSMETQNRPWPCTPPSRMPEHLSMETQNGRAEPRSPSLDPIALVALWPVPLLVFVIGGIVEVLLEPLHPPDLVRKASWVAVSATIVVWWLSAVGGATRRGVVQPAASSVGALLTLSSKVAFGVLMAKLAWLLLQHALGLPRIGWVTAPKLVTNEATAQSFVFTLFLMALLAPVAEEMLFRGALFRKWRLKLGPGTAAVVTSVLFGLAHASAPTSALTALSLAVLYTTTRTIWAPVAAHVMNNLFAVGMAHSGRYLPLAVLEALSDWPLQLAAAVPAAFGTFWLVRFVRRGWRTLGDPVDGVPAG
jgi:membrane protease YdiL (CAAX protease family)